MALRLLIPGVKSKMRRVALVRLSRAQWVFQVVYFGKAFECSPNWAALAFLRAQIHPSEHRPLAGDPDPNPGLSLISCLDSLPANSNHSRRCRLYAEA
jgi:hypothetical protein